MAFTWEAGFMSIVWLGWYLLAVTLAVGVSALRSDPAPLRGGARVVFIALLSLSLMALLVGLLGARPPA